MVIFWVAFHLVINLVVKAAIHQATVLVIAVLLVLNMSSGLVDVLGPPIVPLKILPGVLMEGIVRNVGFLIVEAF